MRSAYELLQHLHHPHSKGRFVIAGKIMLR